MVARTPTHRPLFGVLAASLLAITKHAKNPRSAPQTRGRHFRLPTYQRLPTYPGFGQDVGHANPLSQSAEL
jgi:hypothetical protein